MTTVKHLQKRQSGRIVWLTLGLVCISSIVVLIEARSRSESFGTAAAQQPRLYGYQVVRAYPHDPQAFTQGLIYRDGFLLESTGLNGRSSLRRVRLETGQVVQQYNVDPAYFAEGLTAWGPYLVQLTWQSNVAFIYDLASFSLLGSFPFAGEGWGVTHDNRRVIVSDGTSSLRFFDPATAQESGRVTVTDRGVPISNINELEMVQDEVFANVWLTDYIARISPRTGEVTGWIDLRGLLSGADLRAPVDVLNGIAYDAERDRLFVTGKLWPKVFEIKLVPQN